MAIAFRGEANTVYTGTPEPYKTVTIPASTQAGDVMILTVTWFDAVDTPTGWTVLGQRLSASYPQNRWIVYTKVAVAGDAGAAVSLGSTSVTGNNGGSASLVVYSGVGSLSDFTFGSSTTASPVTPPGQTLVDAGSWFLYGANNYSGYTGNLILSSHTGQNVRRAIDTASSGAGAFYFNLVVADEAPAATGTTGTRSAAFDSGEAVGWSLLLNPGSASQTVPVGRAATASTARLVTTGNVLLRDDFNRANNTTAVGSPQAGGPYTVVTGTWGINGNQLYTSASTAGAMITAPGAYNLRMTATLANIVSSNAILFRYRDANNWWFFGAAGTTTVTLIRCTGGSQITVFPATPATAGAQLKIEAVDRRIYVYLNGVRRYIADDDWSLNTDTAIGVRMSSTVAARLDDLYAEAITALPLDGIDGSSAISLYKGRDTAAADAGAIP